MNREKNITHSEVIRPKFVRFLNCENTISIFFNFSFFRMAEVAVRHNVKTVGKNEGEVIVDNDRVVRERNPELDKLMEYLSSMSEMMKTEEDMTVKNNLCLNCMKEIIQHHEGKAHINYMI